MGWPGAFAYEKPAEIFREHAALSAFENEGPKRRLFDIGALADVSDEEYENLSPIFWPLPRGAPKPYSRATRLFGDGRGFSTADGRVPDQGHAMTRPGRLPRLMAHEREPMLDVHPADAARFRLADGGLVRVESPHGETVLPVRVSRDLREGEVFAPIRIG